jgi:hypothetical protein
MDDMLLREPGKPMKWFILLNGTWIKSEGGGGDGWVTTRSIDEGGDEQQRVNFDGTKWVRANDTGDAEKDVPRPAR